MSRHVSVDFHLRLVVSLTAAPSSLCLETNTNRPMQGAGGGPIEDNVAGLLVRSTSTNWANGSILGIDPGKQLAAIIRIIEEHLPQAVLEQTPRHTTSECIDKAEAALLSPNKCSNDSKYATDALNLPASTGSLQNNSGLHLSPAEPAKLRRFLSTGPFASLELPYESAQAIGAYIIRDLISTYLISHPHLDHVGGLIVNTASFQIASPPKRLAALPSTIDAIRDHIFNEIIWPNLSDENGGVGLVTYVRLKEAGIDVLSENESVPYLNICNGLSVKCWSVSHGYCMKGECQKVRSRNGTEEFHVPHSSASSKSQTTTSKLSVRTRQAIDSSAFFLRDDQTGNEVLIFGDVEPDSLSVSPRTAPVWGDAAEKIVGQVLKGVFIECSYDDSRSDETLFGHLCPRHLIFELQILAAKVESLRQASDSGPQDTQKRKRKIHDSSSTAQPDRAGPSANKTIPRKSRRRTEESSRQELILPSSSPPTDTNFRPIVGLAGGEAGAAHRIDVALQGQEPELSKRSRALMPLRGLQVIIVHVKDTLQDGSEVSDTILAQLRQHEKVAQLGCEFVIPKAGSSIWL